MTDDHILILSILQQAKAVAYEKSIMDKMNHPFIIKVSRLFSWAGNAEDFG